MGKALPKLFLHYIQREGKEMALSHLSNYAMFKLEALGTRDDDMMMDEIIHV